jgi:hypothetical protein
VERVDHQATPAIAWVAANQTTLTQGGQVLIHTAQSDAALLGQHAPRHGRRAYPIKRARQGQQQLIGHVQMVRQAQRVDDVKQSGIGLWLGVGHGASLEHLFYPSIAQSVGRVKAEVFTIVKITQLWNGNVWAAHDCAGLPAQRESHQTRRGGKPPRCGTRIAPVLSTPTARLNLTYTPDRLYYTRCVETEPGRM